VNTYSTDREATDYVERTWITANCNYIKALLWRITARHLGQFYSIRRRRYTEMLFCVVFTGLVWSGLETGGQK